MSTLTVDWQQQLAEAFTSIDQLCRHLQLDAAQLALSPEQRNFPLRVPRGFVDCIKPGDPADPLLRQVLPIQAELEHYPGYGDDPVGDLPASTVAGVIHKYQGRVLLIVTGGCAVHCRYCFRRNFPYGDQQLAASKLEQALDYIAVHGDISEVILSGGDPLLLNDDKFSHLLRRIAAIETVQRIRLHSRIPIVLPARVTAALLSSLSSIRPQVILVTHANHGNELSPAVAEALAKLRASGVTLLNQSVLLAGVNDSVDVLAQLSGQLFRLGVLPYYLHLLDKARGTGHFEVPENTARQLLQQLQCRLPGYLLPRLVREQAGAAHKILLG